MTAALVSHDRCALRPVRLWEQADMLECLPQLPIPLCVWRDRRPDPLTPARRTPEDRGPPPRMEEGSIDGVLP